MRVSPLFFFLSYTANLSHYIQICFCLLSAAFAYTLDLRSNVRSMSFQKLIG